MEDHVANRAGVRRIERGSEISRLQNEQVASAYSLVLGLPDPVRPAVIFGRVDLSDSAMPDGGRSATTDGRQSAAGA